MVSKVNLDNVSYILEPSAGKGDIIDGLKRYISEKKKTYLYVEHHKGNKPFFKSLNTYKECLYFINERHNQNFADLKEADNYFYKLEEENKDLRIDVSISDSKLSEKIFEIEAVEIDKSLQAILKDKNITVVGDDFINYNPMVRYDLIMMNPPFKDGDKHLLKALKMLENGGQCVCILNAETLKNPYSDSRQFLLNVLERYNADVEYIENAFSSAENTTDVEIALVYVDIPKKEIELDVFENLIMGEDYNRNYENFEETQLATDDIIGNLVRQYTFESKAGIKIIDTFYSMQKYIPTLKDNSDIKMISLGVVGFDEEKKVNFQPVNTYIRQLRDKYWSLLFNSKEMSRLLTQTTRNKFLNKIREFRDYDFTLSNIRQIQMDLISDLSNNIDEAILKQFDDFTYKYSMDNSCNVHYFNGWKTNSAFMIKPKVIVACYGVYDSRWGSSWSLYKASDFLEELEKIFVYLDGGGTSGESISSILYSNKGNYGGERISFKYFDVEFKKKGTMHIWFTNEELLKKFNIFGCQKHGWLPNSYGKKDYKDMSKEEQNTVDNFEGEKAYNKVISNSSYYIGGNNLIQIGMN